MTMIAACRFHDGAVMIADARATWLGRSAVFQDSLQKLLPLGPKTVVAYAGDVRLADKVIQRLRQRIKKMPRLSIPKKLASYIPRVASYCYGKNPAREGLSLVFGGVAASGEVEIWYYDSPRFIPHKLTQGPVVRGSGQIVAKYIEDNFGRWDSTLPDLKTRADAMHMGLEAELSRKGEPTVGGLFQIVLLQADGIRPMRHHFMDFNPTAPPKAMKMEFVAGRWVQSDLSANLQIPLLHPAELMQSTPKLLRVRDYDLAAGGLRTPGFHLSYFVTCVEAKRQHGDIEFTGVVSCVAGRHYPAKIPILAAVGLWGSNGDHELQFKLVEANGERLLHSEKIHIEYFPEYVEFIRRIPLELQKPGPSFLECWIGGQLLGRRALYFAELTEPWPTDQTAYAAYAKKLDNRLPELQRACSDSALENAGDTALVYLSLCRNCIAQDTSLRFEGEMAVLFYKTYPLKTGIFVASAFRMKPGTHSVRMELVNAATRSVTPLTTATVESTSSCIVTPIHGAVTAIIPEPGVYFVNVNIDGRLAGTAWIAAETEKPRYMYSITDSDAARVSNGELLNLVRYAKKASG